MCVYNDGGVWIYKGDELLVEDEILWGKFNYQ
jgi:hypothetical protein